MRKLLYLPEIRATRKKNLVFNYWLYQAGAAEEEKQGQAPIKQRCTIEILCFYQLLQLSVNLMSPVAEMKNPGTVQRKRTFREQTEVPTKVVYVVEVLFKRWRRQHQVHCRLRSLSCRGSHGSSPAAPPVPPALKGSWESPKQWCPWGQVRTAGQTPFFLRPPAHSGGTGALYGLGSLVIVTHPPWMVKFRLLYGLSPAPVGTDNFSLCRNLCFIL